MSLEFEYFRARSVDEAIAIKASHLAAYFWAGGTDLIILRQKDRLGSAACIDISGLEELRYIREEPDKMCIGALATLADLERTLRHHPQLKVLSATARLMCTPQTRTLATIGGNLCHASPSADLVPPLVALDSVLVVRGPAGTRELPLQKFLTGVNKTALREEEILIGLWVPLPGGAQAASYQRVARTVVDIALVSASTTLTVNAAGRVTKARVVLGAVGPTPVRCLAAEQRLSGQKLATLSSGHLRSIAASAAADSRPISDIRASKDYRHAMCEVLTARALEDCVVALQKDVA